jgi:protein-glucosylgalactosylhydroxylysine glucosidase
MNRCLLFCLLLALFGCDKIDRFALVSRHTVVNTEINPLNSLTVGNGEFAYTADITGMQTFPRFYEKGISLGTQSQWGWHSFPNHEGFTTADVMKRYKVGSDSIPYIYQYNKTDGERRYNASMWLRENPHRLHLGLIGLEITKANNREITISDIENPRQMLNLWTGELKSTFNIDGIPVEVITCCHQQMDLVAFRITSALINQGRLKVTVKYPYAVHDKFSPGYDISSPEKHKTVVQQKGNTNVLFRRQLDSTVYYSQFDWKGLAEVVEKGNHSYEITPSSKSTTFELGCLFSEEPVNSPLPGFSSTAVNSRQQMKKFWKSGAAVDFSECTDPRAFELERRIILSQYLTKIQCTGSLPPQEIGLTMNSWHGKFHMEMLWWHVAHYIQWGRAELMEKQLQFYFTAFEKAKATAAFQGYKGARWQKMTDPFGNESPSTVGTFLIWQQPHLIYLTDLLYRYHKNDLSVLKRYSELEEATADFMASYARRDTVTGYFLLGPALIPAQECFDPATTVNPSFELAYWRWALQMAQDHRELLGLGKKEKWQQVIDNLAPLPIKDSLYLFSENATDSYNNPRYLTDHPIVLGIEGMLPSTGYSNREIMEATFNEVIRKWKWETCWGWDFPFSAMCATSLDKQEKAIDLLLMETPKNNYLLNGHNFKDETLPLYLPGNSSLLSAVAFMCSYRNKEGGNGFPANGKWKVKYENFFPLHQGNH